MDILRRQRATQRASCFFGEHFPRSEVRSGGHSQKTARYSKCVLFLSRTFSNIWGALRWKRRRFRSALSFDLRLMNMLCKRRPVYTTNGADLWEHFPRSEVRPGGKNTHSVARCLLIWEYWICCVKEAWSFYFWECFPMSEVRSGERFQKSVRYWKYCMKELQSWLLYVDVYVYKYVLI